MDGTAPALEERIATLEAIEEIVALKSRYWRSVDRGDADAVAQCVTEDVQVDFEGLPPFDGREAFVAMVRAAANQPGVYHMHHGRNPVIALTGRHEATAEWDIFYSGIMVGARILIQMAGRYDDRYRRVEGRWRISAMTMRQTSFLTQSIDDDGTARISGLPDGTPPDFASRKDSV